MIIALIVLDIFWSLAGFVVDYPKLLTIPVYLWPVVLICPIYPLLLAFIWYRYIKKKPTNQYLVAFTAFNSVVFGVLAIAFYPTAMHYQGFSWRDVGQIFWVMFYCGQGLYFLERSNFGYLALAAPAFYLMLKLFLDYKFATFGYLNVEGIDQKALLAIYLSSLLIILLISFWKLLWQHFDKANRVHSS